MRSGKYKIARAIELHNQGLTSREIARKIKGVSHSAVVRWLNKFKVPRKERIITRTVYSTRNGRKIKPYTREFKIR